jgi:hypothetical protein
VNVKPEHCPAALCYYLQPSEGYVHAAAWLHTSSTAHQYVSVELALKDGQRFAVACWHHLVTMAHSHPESPYRHHLQSHQNQYEEGETSPAAESPAR